LIDGTSAQLAHCGCLFIFTAHLSFDCEKIVQYAPVIFDARNGTRGVEGAKAHVFFLS